MYSTVHPSFRHTRRTHEAQVPKRNISVLLHDVENADADVAMLYDDYGHGYAYDIDATVTDLQAYAADRQHPFQRGSHAPGNFRVRMSHERPANLGYPI